MLKCWCGNETEFTEHTIVRFTVDAEKNREEKICEEGSYTCRKCGNPVEET